MAASRNSFIDYLKGIAIFLVVWGHCIQYSDTYYNFSDNKIFLFIYSFHMPLFMGISGYLFAFSSKRKNVIEMAKTKFEQLVLPLIFWGLILSPLVFHKEIFSHQGTSQVLHLIKFYLIGIPNILWFLWVLFAISTIFSLIADKFNDKIVYHILAFLVLLIFPDVYGFIFMKFMYPFFLLGYYYNLKPIQSEKLKSAILYGSFIIFPVLLLFFWTKEDLIYNSTMSIYKPNLNVNSLIALKRYLIGFTGIIFVVTIIKKVLFFDNAKLVEKLGVFSLGIYIVQTILFSAIDWVAPKYEINIYLYTFLWTIIVAVTAISLSILLTKVFSRIPKVGNLLFGGRY